MNKRTVIELIALKLSGEATLQDLRELDELIAKNPDYSYYQDIFGQVSQHTLQKGDINHYYENHRLKYADKLVFDEEKVATPKTFNLSFSLLAACLAFLMLSASAIFIYNNHKKAAAPHYNTQIVSGHSVKKNLVLPDGTRVWLNEGSRLLYDKNLNNKDVRAVKLIGEAFFDVAHKKESPFIITTDKVSIKVLGTAFNVKAYPGDKNVETTLLRG